MRTMPMAQTLSGIVEVDETYIGGRSRKGIRGRGSERKAPVLGLIERHGNAIVEPISRVDAETLQTAIKNHVDKDSTISTDEWPSYNGIGNSFTGGHLVVHHKNGEYVSGKASTNQAESYFALLKRGVYGIFHHVSRKHLFRYCDEFSFRWNNRKTKDGTRTVNAIKGFVGKRLAYSALIRN
jgi:transposase-like protein